MANATTRHRNNVRERLWQRQKGRCCYCGCGMADPKAPVGDECRRLGLTTLKAYQARLASREHLQRRTDGGSNRVDNLALACIECNSGRGAVDWLTWKTIRMGEVEFLDPDQQISARAA